MHLVHSLPPYFSRIYSNVIFPSTHRSSEWPLPFKFSNQNIVCISHRSHVCYMCHPSHPPRFGPLMITGGVYNFWSSLWPRMFISYRSANCTFMRCILFPQTILWKQNHYWITITLASACMKEMRRAHRILVGRPEGKRPLGRPRRRWEDHIRMDLRDIVWEFVKWIHLVQDREQNFGRKTWKKQTTRKT
jgi:hypothetical protein